MGACSNDLRGRGEVVGSGIALATGPWVTPEMVPRLLELMENPTPPRLPMCGRYYRKSDKQKIAEAEPAPSPNLYS
jgi:hypothetical protein